MAKGIYQTHYTNEKTLSFTFKDGTKPNFYFVCSRGRSLGKTYSFSKTLFESAMLKGEKFILLTRRKKDLGSIAEGVLKSYMSDNHPEYTITEKRKQSGTFSVVYFERIVSEIVEDKNGEEKQEDRTERTEVGYVIPLAAASDIKRISSYFSDAWHILFDEFMPMSANEYLKNEVTLFTTIYESIARGKGGGDKVSIRPVKVYFLSNCINVFNPYFISTGLVKNIQTNTRIYTDQEKSLLYERCAVEGASEKQAEKGIGRTFNVASSDYSDDNSWLTSNECCTTNTKGWGQAMYLYTLKCDTNTYAVKYYMEMNMIYIDRKPDKSARQVYNITFEGNLNIEHIRSSPTFQNLRKQFLRGKIRFSDSGVQADFLNLFI